MARSGQRPKLSEADRRGQKPIEGKSFEASSSADGAIPRDRSFFVCAFFSFSSFLPPSHPPSPTPPASLECPYALCTTDKEHQASLLSMMLDDLNTLAAPYEKIWTRIAAIIPRTTTIRMWTRPGGEDGTLTRTRNSRPTEPGRGHGNPGETQAP